MSNIFNHNRIPFELTFCKKDYWDFHLSEGVTGDGVYPQELTTDCLSVYIDLDDPDCIWYDNILSKPGCYWEGSNNFDGAYYNIGMTGVDNGLFLYKKDQITSAEFLNIFLNSEYSCDFCQNRLLLHPVGGNNGVYQYPYRFVTEGGHVVAELKGGFFQGFFCDADRNYQVLPQSIENGWVLEVRLKPAVFSDISSTLNIAHPENKGIFLYIGTRAENKWYKLYDVGDLTNDSALWSMGYLNEAPNITGSYFSENYFDKPEYFADDYFLDYDKKEIAKPIASYVQDGYVGETLITDRYVDDEYVADEVELPEITTIHTNDGHALGQPNIKEINTDNKFILFNHTKEGFTTKNWSDDNIVRFSYVEKPQTENYFTLFHHGNGGYTTKNIDDLLNVLNKKYDIMGDLYQNALAFQITDQGAVRYKYFVKGCDGNADYKIESESTVDGVVALDEWHTVSAVIKPTSSAILPDNGRCGLSVGKRDKMVIHLYVDGKLKLISKELPMLNLKALNDLSSRQEGVPFNISLGGGTQGLCDVVYTDYLVVPKDILPLEKEFGGSFEGYISKFRFYTCPIDFPMIFINATVDALS